MSVFKQDNRIKLAVIEGFHPYEVPQWHEMFRGFADEVDYYQQVIDNWAFNCAGCLKDYDALLFYNMNMKIEDSPFAEQITKAIETFGKTGQGIFFLHHAILAYPENRIWSDAIGIADRKFDFYGDQDYTVEVENPDHPITKGVSSFKIHDETYTMNEPAGDCGVLLTADCEKSMKTIGWTKQYEKSRVFCFQCGHDHLAWKNPAFKKIVLQGIKWCANKI